MRLIPVDELLPFIDHPPERLAARFAVPIQQVLERLRELRDPLAAADRVIDKHRRAGATTVQRHHL